MKEKILLIAAGILIVFSAESLSAETSNISKKANFPVNPAPPDYKIEHVLINGIWWVHVYEGDILVASYELDDED